MLTADEQAAAERRHLLSLARARVLQDLQQTCDRRRRGQLETALADLDRDLAAASPPGTPRV